MTWGYSEATGEYGIFAVWVWDSWVEAEGTNVGVPIDTDVTFFRDIPVQILSLDYADPFGPTTATLSFPQITGFDSKASIPWLKPFTNVDVYYLPCTATSWHAGESTVLNPLDNSSRLYVHEYDQTGTRILPIWEGFINNIDPTPTDTQIGCQGALYQLDHFYSKPLNPLRPKRVEELIARYFDPARRGIWTKPLIVDRDRFTRTYTQWDHDRLYAQGGARFTPTSSDNDIWLIPLTGSDDHEMHKFTPWTTWLTRSTGTWDKALTGYIQSQLATMYAMPDSALRTGEPSSGTDITNGDQWTITCDPGRQPRLYLRRQSDPPTLVASYGGLGVDARLTEDGGLSYNVVFAQGTGPDGISWNGMLPLGDAAYLTWEPVWPLPADDSLYVGWERNNNLLENYDGYAAYRDRSEGNQVIERYIADFPSGIGPDEGLQIARMWAERDAEPGWSGSITLSVDLKTPEGGVVSKWDIQPGDVLHLAGFQGELNVVQGINKFHVSQVTKSPQDGTVTLTVDTKYRDLLTIEHAIASGKDTLSVVRANRTGQMMNQIQDIAAPWSANHGAGVMPTSSHKSWIKSEVFPYTDFTTTVGNRPKDLFRRPFRDDGQGFSHSESWASTNPRKRVVKMIETPRKADQPDKVLSLQNTLNGSDLSKGLYVPVQAGAADKTRRWAFFPLLLASAGSIYRTEFACYDKNGALAPVEYSVTMYSADVDQSSMPMDLYNDPEGTFSALWDGAFEKVRRSGQPWPETEAAWHWGNDTQQIGWGTFDRPCGYSPGTKDFANVAPTGMMVDGATWEFSMNDNTDWSTIYRTAPGDVGYTPPTPTALSYWVAVYVQIPGKEAQGVGDPEDATGLNWVYFRGRCFRAVNIGSGS